MYESVRVLDSASNLPWHAAIVHLPALIVAGVAAAAYAVALPATWMNNAHEEECPCHGSQFHRDLSVAHGPANEPLHEHEFTLAGTTLTVLKRKA